MIRDREDVRIESPGFLPDVRTGEQREHDVLLTIRSGYNELLVAIECRDRSRPVGGPDVEAFAKKCEETRVNKGLMVSPRGFRRPALIKAEAYGIGCLRLDQIGTLDWMPRSTTARGIVVTSVALMADVPEWNGVAPESYFLRVADGREVPEKHLLERIRQGIEDLGERAYEMTAARFAFPIEGLSVVDRSSGAAFQPQKILVDTAWRVEIQTVPVFTYRYVDSASGAIAEAAVMTIFDGNEKTEVSLVKQAPHEIRYDISPAGSQLRGTLHLRVQPDAKPRNGPPDRGR